jgi:hypothetical protein
MAVSLKLIETKRDDWKERCSEWAQAGHSFEVHGLAESHFLFCEEICTKFDYKYSYYCRESESIAKFTPID